MTEAAASGTEGGRSSAGGSRLAGGSSFQNKVFAWWATVSVARKVVDWSGEGTTVACVGSETGLNIDDVGVILDNGGFVLIQAKSGIRSLTSGTAEVRKAIDQIVSVYRSGLPTVDPRPIDPSRDRLEFATDHTSSGAFQALSTVCDRLTSHPREFPLLAAAVNSSERNALATIVDVIRASWECAAGTTPTDDELRALLRVIVVRRYDFADSGVHRTQAEEMLRAESAVSDAFELLCSAGLRCAAERSWLTRRELRRIVGLSHESGADKQRCDDLAQELRRRTRARRDVRLQAFGLDEMDLAPYFDQGGIVNVPDNGVLILLGDFGSGKSETAETWHRHGIDQLAAWDEVPFPVWLSARELDGQSLEGAVDQQLPGHRWRQGRGASIVIDGVDETDPASAQALLNAACTLTKTYAKVQILLTARPGILATTGIEESMTVRLSEDAAMELVELAGGRSRHTWQWSPDMRATVRRPFFALAAGVMLRKEEVPKGEADLIRSLVGDALTNAAERSAISSAETWSVLKRLAIALTRTGTDRLSFRDQQIATSSRLTARSHDRSIMFSLPIFQHWFAAQAIVENDISASEVVADAPSFNRWRWAAAVAALSAQGEAVDDLLEIWVAENPGAASWVINEAFSGHRSWRTREDERLDPRSSGARLLRALRTWTGALGPLAPGVLPKQVVEGPVELGVSVSGHWIDIAYSTTHPADDRVTASPQGLHHLAGSAVPGWHGWYSGRAPQGNAWPWTWVRMRIASATGRKLAEDPYLGAPDGVWVQERRYDLARRLLGHGPLLHNALAADEVRAGAVKVFDAIDRRRDGGIRLGGAATYSAAELDDLISWIDATAPAQLQQHLPEGDGAGPTGGFIWSSYSPQRLSEFEAEVYERACQAYDEAVAHVFDRLAWSMPSTAFAPFGVLLEMRYHDVETTLGNIPTMTAMRVPMALLSDLAADMAEPVWSTSRRAVITSTRHDTATDWNRHSATIESIRLWLAENNYEPIAGLGWTNTGADDMSKPRPASSLAVDWLWDDLTSIGLAKGVPPELK
ncbi:NACHT domain-containing protein [Mycobacterium kansasii]|uniref:NACHT domain-containing protein n=1 Tax=Mycobacterium kansasii TaxID=1768 RepID=UPI0010570C6E|nr:hypothetical protein [Mycobacterium kansasii]